MSGRISDERFTELSADYDKEQKDLKTRAPEIEAELERVHDVAVNVNKFMEIIRRNTGFEKLTHAILCEFIDRIVVHEATSDEQGKRRQEIDIYYRFVGKVDLPEA